MLRGCRAITVCLACWSMLFLLPGSAAASIGIESFSLSLATVQAGAHPDLNVDFSFEHPGEPETALTAAVELPPGFFLYPGLAPHCTDNQFATLECPIASQVGVVTIHGSHEGNPDFELGMAPVYIRTRENGELAHLAFVIPTVEAVVNVPVTTTAETDYAPMLSFEGLPKATPIASIDFELWGIPAAPNHDALRFPIVPGGRASNVSQEPFIRNPTACGNSNSTLHAASYEDISNPSTMTVNSPSIIGCGKLPHPYSLEFAIDSTETATAAGLEVELLNPQNLTPQGLSSPDLESASAFVDGLEIDEGAASALSVCTPAQAHLGDNDPADCPPGSKIGTLTAAVAGTENPLAGSVYLGAAEPSGEYEVFLVASGSGIELKIPAWLASGVEIPELPQLPLAKLDVRVDPAASVLLTPPACGTFDAFGEMTDWSDPFGALVIDGFFKIDSGPGGGPCPAPGSPQQTQTPPSAMPATTPRPVVKLIRRPSHRSHDRTPTFRFTSTVAKSTFKCKVDHRSWRSCHSPQTLRKLPLGSHTFRIRAIAPAGERSAVATYRFVIAPKRPPA